MLVIGLFDTLPSVHGEHLLFQASLKTYTTSIQRSCLFFHGYWMKYF